MGSVRLSADEFVVRIPVGRLAFLAAVSGRIAPAALDECFRLARHSLAMVTGRQKVDQLQSVGWSVLHHGHNAQFVHFKVENPARQSLKAENKYSNNDTAIKMKMYFEFAIKNVERI